MRAGLGTLIASTPSVERTRTRKFLPFLSSSRDATVTGRFRKLVLSTGVSRIRSNWALVTFRGSSAARTLADAAAKGAAAAQATPAGFRKRRRELFTAMPLNNKQARLGGSTGGCDA